MNKPASHQHLDDTWMPTFTQLRMTAFGQTVIDIANDSAFDDWTFSEKIIFAVEKEVAARAERRFSKLLKASMTPLPEACTADIHYTTQRNLTRELTSRLAHCQWIQRATNIVGPSPRIVDTGFVANLVGFYLRRRPRNHRD